MLQILIDIVLISFADWKISNFKKYLMFSFHPPLCTQRFPETPRDRGSGQVQGANRGCGGWQLVAAGDRCIPRKVRMCADRAVARDLKVFFGFENELIIHSLAIIFRLLIFFRL